MSSQILLFDQPERFTVGTVGPPGERTFFIQAQSGTRLISVSLEKTQVQALADRLLYTIRDIKQNNASISFSRLPKDDAPLSTPIEEEFRVGVIGLAYDAQSGLIQVDMQAINENSDQDPEFIDVDDLTGDLDILRVLITPSEADRFSKRAFIVVGAGRQPCPFCGGPIDIKGHLCPRSNGYRR
jgi:uncharacterized repeat protein (TIGR03847 family)